MAWASVGTLGTVGSATANQTSLTLTTSATLEAGNFGVIVVVVDNNQTTDGDEGAVTSTTDSAGNTWLKAIEFCNGQGAAQAGVTVSVWWCVAGVQLTSGGTITANFSNATSRDASCATAWEFTMDAANVPSVQVTNTLANDAADPGSLDVTTANEEFLRLRATGGETNNNTQWTGTTNFTNLSSVRSSNAAAAVAARAEFRIFTGTSSASNPTWTAVDCASVYVAFQEVLAGPSLWGPVKPDFAWGRHKTVSYGSDPLKIR